MKRLQVAGFGTSDSSLIAAPMSLVWLGIALWLGKRYRRMIAGDEMVSRSPRATPATAARIAAT